jgi:hypothetical protein
MANEDELRSVGQETIFTAKGHFKASDWHKLRSLLLLFICLCCDVVGIAVEGELGKVLNIAGAILTGLLLIWEAQDGKNFRDRHKEAANKYLTLHKDIRKLYRDGPPDEATFEELRKRQRELDEESRPDISWLPRMWAKWSIEKFDETENWWKTSNQKTKQ